MSTIEKDIWADVKPRFKKGQPPSVDCGAGWKRLVLKLVGALDKAWDGYDELLTGRDCWHILQVKEKMGALVVHAEVGMNRIASDSAVVAKDHETRTRKFNALLGAAHIKSQGICEKCGGAGQKRFLIGAYKTLCDACFVKWDEARTSQVR